MNVNAPATPQAHALRPQRSASPAAPWELPLRGAAIALIVVGLALAAAAFATPRARDLLRVGVPVILLVTGIVLHAVGAVAAWLRGED